MRSLAVIDNIDVALFGVAILLVFLFFFCLCIFTIWLNRRRGSLSPYSRLPMRRGSEIPYDSAQKVLRFMYNLQEYDNRLFDLRRAAVCRETGRIFPSAINWLDQIDLDWDFLRKRYPGTYVSWGSLSESQQEIVRISHDTMVGFQVEYSSPNSQPRAIEAKYAFLKPGPLYVNIDNNILLGWVCVPGTDLEVLVVQKPTVIITPSIT